jgi:hypothetical protein
LIIAEQWLDTLPLIDVVNEKAKYLFFKDSIELDFDKLYPQFKDIYILSPSPELRQRIERSGGQLEATENSAFWRIVK